MPSDSHHNAIAFAGSGQAPGGAASPVFSVDYGAYAAHHAAYARRLARSLAELGITAKVERARASNGKLLYRVRSIASGMAAAERAADDARRTLPVDPLIRRTAGKEPRHGRPHTRATAPAPASPA